MIFTTELEAVNKIVLM